MAVSGSPKLELRQSQQLVMTTQLQQSIRLLQLSSLEVTEFLAHEMEQNPFLSREEGGDDTFEAEAPAPATQREEDVVDFSAHTAWDEGAENALDVEKGDVWGDADGGAYLSLGKIGRGGDFSGEGERDISERVSDTPSLQEHLRQQLQVDIEDAAERIIGLHLIDMVDERGYLPPDLSGLAEALKCEAEDIERVLVKMQRFEPSGVFARSLSECLAIQLREQDRLNPPMQKLLDNLDMMAAGELRKLARICGVEDDELPYLFAEIRSLNPKPGYAFGSEPVQALIPDVLVRRTVEGEWRVELNPDALPKVLVNQRYFSHISDSVKRKEDKKYLADQLQHAHWLIKALDQRAQSILAVATEIVRQQQAFFRKGVKFIKPLTLRDIAQEVSLHESTVSRVTTQKYLAYGAQLYELKYFFSSSVGSTEGMAQHSSEAIKYRIKELIENESPKDILSDDAIADMLKEKGIDIARRTVAKYREAMNIPTSATRKREKRTR